MMNTIRRTYSRIADHNRKNDLNSARARSDAPNAVSAAISSDSLGPVKVPCQKFIACWSSEIAVSGKAPLVRYLRDGSAKLTADRRS